MTKLFRTIAGALCLLLSVWFLLPLGIGILHIGMLWPTALLLIFASLCFFPRWTRRLPRWMRRLGAVVIGAGLAVVAALLVLMITAAADRPGSADAPGTVVVLGCQVSPGGRPSVMLRSRINAAYGYLTSHPDAVCVASGGKDDAETVTEAQCIRDTLVAMGIDPGRIYMEDASGSTAENLSFSAAVIAEQGLDPRVALATDNFHQYRGQFFARRAGLTPYSVGCSSYLPLAPGYWAREMIAIPVAWMRGY